MQFEREATRVIELVSERMEKYEVALSSGVATVESLGGSVSYEQWKTFASSLHIETKYPGINGIGVVDYVTARDKETYLEQQRLVRPEFSIYPASQSAFHFPIRLIEPEMPNRSAIGLDLIHEKNRLDGALKARDSGLPQITGPIVLVQDEQSTPGFLFYEPYYFSDENLSIDDRRRNFSGLVYAPFIVEKLLAGTLDKSKRLVGITLSDGDQTIYDENMDAEFDYDANPLYKMQSEIEMYGRTWSFDVHSKKSFREATKSAQPTLILLGGIVLDVLLLTLFYTLTRSNRRALRFADGVAATLHRQARSLAQSNADLESFAYVASHDLRTPLRGMSDLVEFLEEDLAGYLKKPSADPEVEKNLGRLNKQVMRLDRLVHGILDYSSIGSNQEEPDLIDIEELLLVLRNELGVAESQLVYEGGVSKFVTYRLRFEQVIGNLVSNAFKYHKNREEAVVTIRCSERDDWFEFVVTDNGPGIDPKYHHRIFDPFQTLQSKDEVEGTGVGLSIVKRTVETLGGFVKVESTVGLGSTFSFGWPKKLAWDS
ncbi:MAG: CHASE domain-containing protein [Halioglobus sp.]